MFSQRYELKFSTGAIGDLPRELAELPRKH